MDTSWWPAVVAVVAVAVVVLVAGGGRAGRPRRGPAARGGGALPRVRAGELWVLADGRECLVLRVGRRGRVARVAWITGKYDDRRAGVIALPPGSGAGGRTGFLEADRPEEISLPAFRTRTGTLDPVVWDEIKGLGGA